MGCLRFLGRVLRRAWISLVMEGVNESGSGSDASGSGNGSVRRWERGI